MSSKGVSLPVGLGYGLMVKERPTAVNVPPATPVTAEQRALALVAVDFCITTCGLGATKAQREAKFKDDLKIVIKSYTKLSVEHIEQLATVLGFTLQEFLAIGKKPPYEQAEAFKRQFTERCLTVNNKHFAKPSFI